MSRPSIAKHRPEEILDAFESCVIEKGLDKTTLMNIAERSGLPRSLVRHFMGNRADLETKLIERVLERLDQKLSTIPASRTEPSPDALVNYVLLELFGDQALNHLVKELWHLSNRSESIKLKLTKMYQRVLTELNSHFALPSQPKNLGQTETDISSVFALAMGVTVMKEFNLNPPSITAFARKAFS